MAELSKTSGIAIQIVSISMELQKNFECRTELKMYKDYFALNVCFYKSIKNLDVLNSICPKADEFYFYAADDCVCLCLIFYLKD